jgi:VIT1/CCC1 family predicted Fe2+/Mn2+ transporter
VEQREQDRVLRNWKDECDSAALYEALAAIEHNPRLSGIFRQLAASELDHARFWADRLRAQECPVPVFRPSHRTRIMAGLARRFGVAFVVPNITARELADRDRYSHQEDAKAAGLTTEERGHAAVMRTIGIYGQTPSNAAGRSQGGAALGNNLRAAILGATDGLVSNFCLLMGVAGADAQTSTILLAGVAGLVAGACSMALAEWLSVTNTREMAQSQIDSDIEEWHARSAWRHKELVLLHEAKGMSEKDARRAADQILAQDPSTTRSLARDEHVFDPAHMGINPSSAAAYSFVLFATGAIIPLLPFGFISAAAGIMASAALSLTALFVLGLFTSFFNARTPLFSGLRQVGIGAGAAMITFLVGRIFGAVIS